MRLSNKWEEGFFVLAAALLFAPSVGFGVIYLPAAEDPVVDGSFSSVAEYAAASKVLDDLAVGYFYKQYRSNWTAKGQTYSDTITFFDNHYFFNSGYGQLDDYDLNSFELEWGNTTVKTWGAGARACAS